MFRLRLAKSNGEFFSQTLSNDLLFTSTEKGRLLIGLSNQTPITIGSNNVILSTLNTSNFLTSNATISQTLTTSDATVSRNFTASNITSCNITTGVINASSIIMNGNPIGASGALSGAILVGGTLGTEASPINGGTINLDISRYNNAVIELASNIPASNLNLNLWDGASSQWSQSVVGTSGNIVLIERSPLGRGLFVDNRLFFPPPVTSPFQTSTAFSNAYSVDTLSYFIPKTSFGFASYTRQFKNVNSSSILKWLSRIGGTGNESIQGACPAPDGGFYVTGYYSSSNVYFYGASNVGYGTPTSGTTFQNLNWSSTESNMNNAFLAKYTSAGNVTWAAQVGNSASESTSTFSGIHVSPATDGGVFMVGSFQGTLVARNKDAVDFTTRQPSTVGSNDIFVAKYTSVGDVQWIVSAGSVGNEVDANVVGTSDGGCVLVMEFEGNLAMYDFTGNGVTMTNTGGCVAIIKYDSTGKLTLNAGQGWFAKIGVTDGAFANPFANNQVALCVGSDNGIYVGGTYRTSSTLTFFDKNMQPHPTTLPRSATNDAFIVKYTSSGIIATNNNSQPWMTRLSSAGGALSMRSLAMTQSDGIVVGGAFNGTNLLTYSVANNSVADLVQPLNSGPADSFVIAYDANGLKSWVTTFRGTSSEQITSVGVAADGDIIATGSFTSSTLVVHTGPTQTAFGSTLTNASAGTHDVFIAKLGSSQGTVTWLARLAGTSDDFSTDAITLGDGGLVLTGRYNQVASMIFYDKQSIPYQVTLPALPFLYTFNDFTFTSGGISGRSGPTIAQLRTSYSSASWAQNSSFLNMSIQGIQQWTVPITGRYRFTVAGASGQHWVASGGGGRIILGTRFLTQGTVLLLVVGQTGGSYGGGGGASFVRVSPSQQLLYVAGGGGGGASGGFATAGLPAPSLSSGPENGSNGLGGNGGAAGSNGSGGNDAGGGGGIGTATTSAVYLGGIYNYSSSATGGFGGGGATSSTSGGGGGGGGGGGFTGGNGGTTINNGGGGGTSYGLGDVVDMGMNGSAGYITVTTMTETEAYLLKMDPSGVLN